MHTNGGISTSGCKSDCPIGGPGDTTYERNLGSLLTVSDCACIKVDVFLFPVANLTASWTRRPKNQLKLPHLVQFCHILHFFILLLPIFCT